LFVGLGRQRAFQHEVARSSVLVLTLRWRSKTCQLDTPSACRV